MFYDDNFYNGQPGSVKFVYVSKGGKPDSISCLLAAARASIPTYGPNAIVIMMIVVMMIVIMMIDYYYYEYYYEYYSTATVTITTATITTTTATSSR